MKDIGQRHADVGLREALPYMRLFKGKVFVVKVGGGVLAEPAATREVLEQVDALLHLGIKVVLVHGGGAQASTLSRALGSEPRFVAGRRVTDGVALAAAVMTLNGEANTALLGACRGLGIPAVGLSGVDAGLVRAQRRPPQMVEGESVDYGHVGDVVAVDPGVLSTLLAGGFLPVVSPLAADENGQLLNCNADGVASALAVALGAVKLVLLTDVAGLLERPADPRSLISYVDLAGLAEMRARGVLNGGMAPKSAALEKALVGGVPRAHLVSWRVPDGLLLELFTNEGSGTLVVPELATLTAAEQAATAEPALP
ncbi:MAG TPA: acetylglutamate kinase [Thermoanaerobaculia bacterium]|jgi:acetylglutamate kinase|nr:acetylglutamate kinase [Thermoanaerobaculia bacterium]